MTPKEKAEELVNKYIGLNSGKLSDYSRIEFPTAKQCALIAIDENINILNEICELRGYDPFESPLYDLNYWKKVKQEIEQLWHQKKKQKS